jgi:hypothetical protein
MSCTFPPRICQRERREKKEKRNWKNEKQQTISLRSFFLSTLFSNLFLVPRTEVVLSLVGPNQVQQKYLKKKKKKQGKKKH